MGGEQIILRQNIKTRIEDRDVVAVNVFGDEAQILVPPAPGQPVDWVPVTTGVEVQIGSQTFTVASVAGTAADLPEGRASGRVVLTPAEAP